MVSPSQNDIAQAIIKTRIRQTVFFMDVFPFLKLEQ